MNASTLTKHQTRIYGPKPITGYGPGALITATVRYDDECGNGHNSFAITGEIVTPASKRRHDCEACGMLHREIAKAFPQLKPFLQWHLTSSDGPMHYVANSLYWAGRTKWQNPNLEHFRSTAVWPDATQTDMETITEEILMQRLPMLLAEFQKAVESLGLIY